MSLSSENPTAVPVETADLLAIQVMRIAESGKATYQPEIDLEIPEPLRKAAASELAREIDKRRLLADRARRHMEYGQNFRFEWLRTAVHYVPLAALLIVFVLATVFWSASRFFVQDPQGRVDISNFAWVMAAQVVWMLFSLATLFSVALQLAPFRKRRGENRGMPLLMQISWAVFMLAWGIVRMFSRWGKANEERGPSVIDKIYQFLATHAALPTALVSFVSQTMWVVVTLIVLGVTLVQIVFSKIDFVWQSTEDLSTQQALVETVGWPFAQFTEIPSKRAVLWVREGKEFGVDQQRQLARLDEARKPLPLAVSPTMSESAIRQQWRSAAAVAGMDPPLLSEEEVASAPLSELAPRWDARVAQLRKEYHGEIAHFRHIWSHYLVGVAICYAMLPRFVLWLISWILMAAALRNLRPRLNEPYYRDTIENILNPPIVVEKSAPQPDKPVPESVSSEIEIVEPVEPEAIEPAPLPTEPVSIQQELEPAQPALPEPVASAPVAKEQVDPKPVAPPPKPKTLWIVAYDVELADASQLAPPQLPFVLRDDTQRAARRKELLEQLESESDQVGFLTLWLSAAQTPDRTMEQFLSGLATILEPAPLGVVLSEGQQVRDRYADDAEKVKKRMDLWRRTCVAQGVPAEQVLEFDHENATASSRSQLHQFLRSGMERNGASRSNSRFQRAGRFSKAIGKIQKKLPELFAGDLEQLPADTIAIASEIRELYADESNRFLEQALALAPSESKIRSEWSKATAFAQPLTDTALQATRSTWVGMRSMTSLFASTPRLLAWGAMAGGVLGLAGPAALVAPAILAPIALHCVGLGAVGGALSAVTMKGMAGAIGNKIGRLFSPSATVAADETSSEPKFAVVDAVRSLALISVVLELQGSPEDAIASVCEQLFAGWQEEEAIDQPALERRLELLETELPKIASETNTHVH